MRTKQVKLQLKEIDDAGKFTGLAAVYGNRDLGGDVIMPGAFTKTIKENGGVFPLMYGHKINVGISSVEDTSEGLLTTGEFNLEKQIARDVYSDVKFYHGKGRAFGMSIGYLPIDGKTEERNGTRYLKELALYENTLTEWPMNPKARVAEVKDVILQYKADFTTELQAVETWAKRYQMMQALDTALGSMIWDDTMTAEEKVQSAEDSIQQFRQAYMEFLPQLLALMESRYKSAIEQFETKHARPLMDAAAKDIRALAGAAHQSTEPVEDHSKLIHQLDNLKGVFRWNSK